MPTPYQETETDRRDLAKLRQCEESGIHQDASGNTPRPKVTLPRGEPADEIDWDGIGRRISILCTVYPDQMRPLLAAALAALEVKNPSPRKEP